MATFITFSTPSPVTHRLLRRLGRRIDRCIGSGDYVRVIRKITATGLGSGHPLAARQAIEMLAALLDSQGPTAHAAIDGLLRFGRAAVAEVTRRAQTAVDADMIRHAHMVLARLGCSTSMRELACRRWVAGTQRTATAPWLAGCGVRGVLVLLEHWEDDDVAHALVARRRTVEDLLLDVAAGGKNGLDLGAMHVLGRMRSRRALPLFRRHLDSSDEARRSVAIEGFAALRRRAAVPMLVSTAIDDTEPARVRQACVEALGALARAA